ncbi:MAG: hypothetical protein LQ339_001107 [Xanthoria mediterranea]|nr:MAG: hypothetical protein LQ339_001107 [Xanthoria mediterranea]
MKSGLFPSILALLVQRAFSQATGQAIIPSNLPACAQTCANLIQAQTACIAPPNPPPGATYGLPCFCGYAPLANLKLDAPANLCATCSSSDNAAIQSWFKGACNNGGQTTSAPNSQTTPATTPSSSRGATPNPTNQATNVSNRPGQTPNDAQKGWISTHWRWVVMLIILVLGLGGIAVGGVYLKRYIHRRRDAQEIAAAGPRQDLRTWGPGQSVHELDPPVIAAGDIERGKGKDIEMVQTQEGTNDRRNSKRLKKFLPGKR